MDAGSHRLKQFLLKFLVIHALESVQQKGSQGAGRVSQTPK